MTKFKKNIRVEIDLSGEEPEFYMRIGFEAIKDIRLSIAHRRLSNRGSGLIRHTGNPTGVRIINGIVLTGVYADDKENARLYHDSVEEHLKKLGLRDENGKNREQFVLITNGNLGNNYWHVAWQKDERDKLYHLADELLFERTYSCFVVPLEGNPRIQRLKFQDPLILTEDGKDISGEINWCNYGQQIVRDGSVVPIEDIVDQFYDIRHIFDWRDWGPRAEEDVKKLNEIFEGYPQGFREKVLNELVKGTPRAKYDHHILGLSDDALVISHQKGLVEELAKNLVDKGVKDAVVLDQGGSSAVYASWPYPNGGYLMQTSRYRPERISTIGIILQD